MNKCEGIQTGHEVCRVLGFDLTVSKKNLCLEITL